MRSLRKRDRLHATLRIGKDGISGTILLMDSRFLSKGPHGGRLESTLVPAGQVGAEDAGHHYPNPSDSMARAVRPAGRSAESPVLEAEN